MSWGTPVEIERRRRIKLSIAAHSYERHSVSIMSDAEFDAMSLEVQPDMDTGHAAADLMFRQHFHPATGMWIHNHPDRRGIERLYQKHYAGE